MHQAIEIGGVRGLVTERSDRVKALLVGHHEQDVRTFPD
jgi:hypothetical protein